MTRDETEKLRSSIRQERDENKKEITKLEQEIADLKTQKQKEKHAEITSLQEQLKLAQDKQKELEYKSTNYYPNFGKDYSNQF
jgi:predicted  nucleic acid-binding Zn-ribbon protein